MTFSDKPQARLEPFECDECTNEVEGVCSTCGAYVCGSCFNGGHEYKNHGPIHGRTHRSEWFIKPLLVQWWRCGKGSKERGWRRCTTADECNEKGCIR